MLILCLQITSSQDNFSVLIWTKLPITRIRWHSNKLGKKFQRIMLLRQIYARITWKMVFYKLLVQSWTILVSIPCPNTFLVGLNSKTNCPKTEFCQPWFRKRCRILEKKGVLVLMYFGRKDNLVSIIGPIKSFFQRFNFCGYPASPLRNQDFKKLHSY